MKRILLLTAGLMFIASLAYTQSGWIAPYADDQGCFCDAVNYGSIMKVYVFHAYPTGASGCQFSIQVLGVPLTFITQSSQYLTLGNINDGISIAYETCVTNHTLILEITYWGLSNPCDMIEVRADPSAVPPGIWVADCTTPTPNLLQATGGVLMLNGDGSCPCTASPLGECLIPVEQTSWGEIKLLYR